MKTLKPIWNVTAVLLVGVLRLESLVLSQESPIPRLPTSDFGLTTADFTRIQEAVDAASLI